MRYEGKALDRRPCSRDFVYAHSRHCSIVATFVLIRTGFVFELSEISTVNDLLRVSGSNRPSLPSPNLLEFSICQ